MTELEKLRGEVEALRAERDQLQEKYARHVGLLTDEEADKYRWLTRAETAEAEIASLRERLAKLSEQESKP